MTVPVEPKPIEIKSEPPNNRRNHLMFWIALTIFALGLAWTLLWFFYLRFYESTDDAYANGNLVTVTSTIAGSPIAYYADDTDFVKEGQLLVLLDDTEARINYQKQLDQLAASVLQARQLYDNVEVAKSAIESKRSRLEKVRYDYENRLQLVASQAISNEDFVHSRDDLKIAEADLLQAENQLKVARDARGGGPIEQHPLIEVQKNAVRTAYYHLYHCAICAPATGYVAKRQVQVGKWVSANTYLMAVIPIDYVWVDANFKETQLRSMRIGQDATVTFDLYGSGVEFKGKVLGIASGTGSVFSLIPPQNATGNWIKIVQRLPVRISLDPAVLKDHPIRVGISAYVSVDVTKTDLPMLAEVPACKAVASTNVYAIDMAKVELAMKAVIQKSLEK